MDVARPLGREIGSVLGGRDGLNVKQCEEADHNMSSVLTRYIPHECYRSPTDHTSTSNRLAAFGPECHKCSPFYHSIGAVEISGTELEPTHCLSLTQSLI
jgi:hypothetical protein